MRVAHLLAFCLLASFAFPQQPPVQPPAASATRVPADLADIVKKQFGSDFTIVSEAPYAKITGATNMEIDAAKWQTFLTGDLDGDGAEDAVIVARNKNSMIGADAYNYKVIDAVNDHFGYGNPKVTVDFNANDPVHNLVLLVIHGAGAEGWRAATPKAKFVLINVPFERVQLGRGKVKKRTVDAIRVEESDTVASVLFWDGKKYRYIPGGGSL
jgi:hypothetical protein